MQAMSRALRRIATKKRVVIVVTVQATPDDGKHDKHDELQIPRMDKVRGTNDVLMDGTVTFGIDSIAGKDAVSIMLSRKRGAGTTVDLQYLPNYGIVRPIDEALAKQMDLAGAIKLF